MNKTFLITFALVLALVAIGQTSARPQIATTSTPTSSVASLRVSTNKPTVVVVNGGEAHYPSDFSDDRNLVGVSQNIFIGKVIGQVKTEDSYTQFAVQVIDNVKGNLQGTVNVGVTGGYRNGVFYVHEGNTWLDSGATYLLATRYRSIDNSYRLITFDSDVSWKLLSENSGLATAQVQGLAQNDSRVKALTAAYPHEVLDQADVYNHTTFNSYASLAHGSKIPQIPPLQTTSTAP